jgi:aldehyde dehydrogenase (NAD+)
VSYNPATGEAIASVVQTTATAYEVVLSQAAESFRRWQAVSAPRRWAVLRELGDLLREYQEPLGERVSLEMGKIQPDGGGSRM